MSNPNILYIHSHDTGRYIQPFGYRVDTPCMQELAEDGLLFRQCHCANPTCSPSRAALLTGQYPHQNGMLGLAHIGWRLQDYRDHVLHTLREHGYTSVLAGVQHIARQADATEIGYDEILDAKRSETPQAAANWLDNAPDQPFFMAVGFGETHRSFPKDHPQDDARYTRVPEPLPDTPDTREDFARYAACVRRLDQKMGEVFEALKRNDLWENTLIICTTDHGLAFPRMKCTLTDSGTGVLLILRGAGGFTGGRVSDSLVSHLDIFPTICDVAGIPPPARLEGKSLCPIAQVESAEIREELHAEVNYHAAYEPKRMVRTRRWKYIRRFDEREKPVLANVDDSLSKTLWLDAGWPAPEQERLFDLILDPNETCNLVQDPDHRGILNDMRNRLRKWQESTDDPILKGHIPPAEGTVFNDINATSPGNPKKPFSEHPQY